MILILLILALLIPGYSYAQLIPPGSSAVITSADGLPTNVLTSANIYPLGGCRLPDGAAYAYGGEGGFALDPAGNSNAGSYFITVYDTFNQQTKLAELTACTSPSNVAAASMPFLTPIQDPTSATIDTWLGDICSGCGQTRHINGLAVIGSWLYVHENIYYDSSHFQTATTAKHSRTLTDHTGAVTYQIPTLTFGEIGWLPGPINAVVTQWQTALGGYDLCGGLIGTSNIAARSAGLTLICFHSADIGVTTPFPTKTLLGYDSASHEQFPCNATYGRTQMICQNDEINQGSSQTPIIIKDADAAWFVGVHQRGGDRSGTCKTGGMYPGSCTNNNWTVGAAGGAYVYGCPSGTVSREGTTITDCPPDAPFHYNGDVDDNPTGAGKGPQGFPGEFRIWNMKTSKLAEVAVGTNNPYDHTADISHFRLDLGNLHSLAGVDDAPTGINGQPTASQPDYYGTTHSTYDPAAQRIHTLIKRQWTGTYGPESIVYVHQLCGFGTAPSCP